MSSMTMDLVSGNYKTVQNGTVSSSTLYSFGADGVGGYEFYGYSAEPGYNLWSWDFTNGEFVANQYVQHPNTGAPYQINDEAALESCIASLDTEPTCVVRLSRTYKVIAQKGNRYTMLRTLYLNQDLDDSTPPTYKSLSVWVFYKQ
ncbi:MAG: hypothetical protein HRT44_03955 [Bdellovibrionales bacterium]|nr:hypothetical protein [Bdellovibrionales bacterium]